MTITHLQLRDVCREIAGFNLGPVSLEIEPGLIYAVVGPNGSGKSTLFRLMMGLISPDSGEISRFDRPLRVDNTDQAQRIAYVPESLTGYESWSLTNLIELYRRSYPRFDPAALHSIDGAIDRNKSFSNLSKGQQRRAMLALAIASGPDLLLLDEPTDGLDPFVRQDVLAELSRSMEAGDRSIVLATHNLEDVRRIADVVVLFHQGRQIGVWNKDDVLEGWQRLTVASAPALPLDGEVARTNGAAVQVVTSNAAATRSHLATLGIQVIQHQPIDMVETLRILLDSSDDADRQTSVTNGNANSTNI